MCYLHPFDWICICFVYPGIYPFVSCSNFLKYRFFKGFFNDFPDFVGICSLFLYIISNFLSLLLARGLAILLIFSEGSVLCLKLCIVHLVLISLFSSMIFFIVSCSLLHLFDLFLSQNLAKHHWVFLFLFFSSFNIKNCKVFF